MANKAIGSDGEVRFNFGGGAKPVANIFSWTASMRREALDQTDLSDEATRRTGGLISWAGDFSMRLEFSDDETIAQSAWQVLDFAFSGTDDQSKAEISLIIQRSGYSPDFVDFRTSILDTIRLAGTVVITGVKLDCTDPGQAVIAVVDWEGDGELTLQRQPPGV